MAGTASYDSSATWRVCAAEQSVPLNAMLPDLAAARALVRRVKRSRWWRDNAIDSPRIRVVLGGREDESGIASYSEPNRSYAATSRLLSIHPRMLQELNVLHEVAHCIAPRYHARSIAPMPSTARASPSPWRSWSGTSPEPWTQTTS